MPASFAHWLGHHWRSLVLGVWLTGSICCFVVSATRVVRFHRLVRGTEVAPGEWIRQVGSLAARLGLRACPEVRVTEAAMPPMVWSVGNRTTLLLPKTLLMRLGAMRRATLLTHELAHIRRGDPYVRWLEALVLGLYWWHPVAWFACRAVQDAAEQCCDDWVLHILPGSKHSYAHTLLETADYLTETPRALPLGASGLGHTYPLLRRIEMIMKDRTNGRLSGWTRAVAALAMGAVLCVSPAFMQGGETPKPPEAGSKPRAAVPAGTSAEAGAKTSAARHVVVVDVNYLFKHHQGFDRSMESQKARVVAWQEAARQRRAKIADLQRQINEAPSGTPQRSELEAKADALKRELEAYVSDKKKEGLAQEVKIYAETWNDINAAITRYARQHGIDLVLRCQRPQPAEESKTASAKTADLKPVQEHGSKQDEDAKSLLARINALVIYQSQAAHGDELDITQEVLAQLGCSGPGPEKSRK